MKYAIISDIHGNLPALNEVIDNARKNGAESYIFVGDYCLSNPLVEVENAYIIVSHKN